MKNYGVWCEVWGGMTGHRCAWYKKDNQIATFTREEAELLAEQMITRANGSPYRTANFRYTAKRID